MARARPVTEHEWLSGNCRRMVIHARRVGTDRKIRLLLCGFCRLFADRLPDDECRAALEQVEQYVDGQITYRRLLPHRVHVETTEWGVDAAFGERSDLAQCLYTALQPSYGQAVSDLPQLQNQPAQAVLLRDLFGNPFQPVKFAKKWRSESAVSLARTAYDTHNFSLLPILADALEEAGCDHGEVLSHCRGAGPHARGCWAVDLVLGKS